MQVIQTSIKIELTVKCELTVSFKKHIFDEKYKFY